MVTITKTTRYYCGSADGWHHSFVVTVPTVLDTIEKPEKEADDVVQYSDDTDEEVLGQEGVAPSAEMSGDLPGTGGPSSDSREEEDFQDDEIEWESGIGRKEGNWISRLKCPQQLFGFLIGKQGSQKNEVQRLFDGITLTFTEHMTTGLEAQQAQKKVPLPKASGTIEIRHLRSKLMVQKARLHLQNLISSRIHTLPYTHFISLPFLKDSNPELFNRFTLFVRECLNACSPLDDKIEDSIFQLPGQLHFTLVMLRLYWDEDVEKAQKVLDGLSSKRRLHDLFTSEDEAKYRPLDIPTDLDLPPPGLHIALQGVYCMQEEPKSTHVLYTTERTDYGNVDRSTTCWLKFRRPGSTYIAAIVEELYQDLCDSGLLDWQELNKQRLLNSKGDPDLKLHVTLANSKFRSTASPFVPRTGNFADNDKQDDAQRVAFDSTKLLQSFSEFDFGVGVIKAIHLSVRGAAAPDTLYYQALHTVPICQYRGF